MRTFSTAGSRAERGHTFSVPQIPIGITGAPLIAASRAAPQRPRSSGSKNARHAGSCPPASAPTMSPLASASAAACNGASDPVPRSTRMPPIALASCPTIGASNTSFLPRKRSGRPDWAMVTAIAAESK